MCDFVISHEDNAIWPLMEGAATVSQTKNIASRVLRIACGDKAPDPIFPACCHKL